MNYSASNVSDSPGQTEVINRGRARKVWGLGTIQSITTVFVDFIKESSWASEVMTTSFDIV